MKRNSDLRKLFAIGLLVFAVLALPGAQLLAEEEKPTGDITAAVLSQYVWRGYELSRNSVVIQPSMTIGYKGSRPTSGEIWTPSPTRRPTPPMRAPGMKRI